MLDFKFSPADARSKFLRVEPIQEGVERTSKQILAHYGRDVRQTDRRSIKPQRQKTLAEMTEGERRSYRRLQRIAKQEGKPKPKKPLAASKPGEAPRRGPEDLIRKFTYYVYDDSTDSVVVGAAKLGNVAADDGTPEAIEQGGTTRLTYGQNKGKRVYMAARPHLTPAYLKHLPQLPGRFRGRFGGTDFITSPSGSFSQPSLF